MASTVNNAAGTRSGKRPIVGIGRIIGWPSGSLWIGRHLGQNHDHAHHAIQISLALEGSFRIRTASLSEWHETKGVVIMPDRTHRFDGCGATVATIFVEPNSATGLALTRRLADSDATLLPDDEVCDTVRYLRVQYLAAAPNDVIAQMARGAVCRLAGNSLATPGGDPRITAALAWMRTRLAVPIRLEEVAAAVHLSPGRFRHLFVAQTGTSVRAWLLWARLNMAFTTASHGRSWTEAAHEAGFADAAHLTRTCRRMFGMAPSMLEQEQPVGHAQMPAGTGRP